MPSKTELPEYMTTQELWLPRVMTVDPGLGGTGWAFWLKLAKPVLKKQDGVPAETGVIKPHYKERDWNRKVRMIAHEFLNVVHELKPAHIVFEYQELWAESATSIASGSGGDIFKTTFLTGFLAHGSEKFIQEPAKLLTPGQWKGQLSKKAVDRRIGRAIGSKYKYDDHTADAVGIGLAILGIL